MEKIWKRHWPPGVDEATIQLPTEPISVILKRNAQAEPRKPALLFYGREVSFGELDEASDRFAGWLIERGLRPGDRVALFLENCPQFAIAYYGALKAGAVNVCLNPMHKAVELQQEFEDSGARVLVTSEPGWALVEPIRKDTPLEAVAVTAYREYVPAAPTLPVPPSFQEPEQGHPGADDFQEIVTKAAPLRAPEPRRLDDTALLQYTSGTTGTPKGAELTHGNIVSNCELQRVYISFDSNDVGLAVLPWFHITGMECQLNMMAYLGATMVALGRFDLEAVLGAIQRYRCTLTALIATVNVAIVNYPRTKEFDLSSLRACFSGGAPVPPEVAKRWEATTGYKLIEGYGLSETCAPSHVNPPHRPKYGTVGLPLPLSESKIVSLEDGVTEMPLGESGEVVIRGPMVMKGYWRRPDATAEAIPQDGFFRSGDIGRMDEEGYFRIEERKKDMIKASGYSVFPAEVEAIMYRHPAVAEVGVVGVPDPYRGEDIVGFVVLKADAKGKVTEQQIAEWCHSEMAVYKAPRRICFTDALPKTASGKILKRMLREKAREAAPAGSSASPGAAAPPGPSTRS
jgi:acyl-CoA synthetase (AMP-forming)/AMP-acid ligase II